MPKGFGLGRCPLCGKPFYQLQSPLIRKKRARETQLQNKRLKVMLKGSRLIKGREPSIARVG